MTDPLMAISPIDGRYAKTTRPLRRYMSECGLISSRIVMEVAWLIALSEHPEIPLRSFTRTEKRVLRAFRTTLSDARQIKKIETTDTAGRKRTNHDVKAVELFLRDELSKTSLEDTASWIHIFLTSEDVNNIAYGLMFRGVLEKVLLPRLDVVIQLFEGWTTQYAVLAMLAATHGQPASPTTWGKEINVFACRIRAQLAQLRSFRLRVKCNGATGNFNAHVAAYPSVDWITFSRDFIEQFNASAKILRFEPNPVTTQIEPHDTYAEFFGILMRISNILIDFCQDGWQYISDMWLVLAASGVGSSIMPHKVNPIDLENAEGNLEVAIALMELFCRKLTRSRRQRDLSDSTVERNFGVALAHCLIAYEALIKAFKKITPHTENMRAALERHPEVLGEAFQTILRREGVTEGYEILRNATQGKPISLADLHDLVPALPVEDRVKQELLLLRPETYTGLASTLALLRP